MLDFVNTLNEQIEGIHSVMLVRHGQVIVEGWWAPFDAETITSASRSRKAS